ncbi:MAG: hypothetical protein OXI16_02090 [Chloroflexota bacterium]|nr:hypothetical protein [Chloroflexota bacterium]
MAASERGEGERPRRASVWSVSEGWLTAYFALFTVQFVTGISLVVWYETAVVTLDSPIETLMNVLWRAGVIPILSASTSYIFAEGGRLTMVISNWVERKLEEREQKRAQALIEQGRKEGIEIGREEGIEIGRTLERERIAEEANGYGSDESPSADGKKE